MVPEIDISSLSYHYPDGTRALSDINLSVGAGERLAIIGSNGAGKTTLLYHLNGLLAGEGHVRIQGMEVSKPNLGRIRAKVGFVFQNPDDQLFSPSVYEDVAFGPIYQGYDREQVAGKVRTALAAVGMDLYGGRHPYHLSHGEKKRIAIATILSMETEILVYDEPTAGLDPRARREFIDLMQRLPQTMLIATHDLDLVKRISRRTVILNSGRISADGTTHDILADKILLEQSGLI